MTCILTRHVTHWDALDQRVRQRVPVLANIQQRHTAIEDEWDNIPQATINSLINSMQRRRVALHEVNGGHIIIRTGFLTPFPLKRLQRFFFLRKFYSCTIKSILTGCITVWYGNFSASDRKAIQRLAYGRIRRWSFLKSRTYILGGVRGRP